MVSSVPMVARRLAVAMLLAGAAAWATAQAADAGASAPQSDSQSQAGSSSSVRHKPKASGKAVHHTVAEEESPPPELAKAEALIQQQDYAGAEPLLKKLLEGE